MKGKIFASLYLFGVLLLSCKKDNTVQPTNYYIKFKGNGQLYTFKDVAEGRLGYNVSFGYYSLLLIRA